MSRASIRATVTRIITTAPVVLVPTSFGPPLVERPQPQAITAICRPKTTALSSMAGRSLGSIQVRTEFQNTEGGML